MAVAEGSQARGGEQLAMRVLLGGSRQPERRLTARLLWEPRDAWVGVFWNRASADAPRTSDQTFSGQRDRFLLVDVCLVPCLPLAVAWRRAAGPSGGDR